MDFYNKLNESLVRKFLSPNQIYLDISNPRFFGEREFDLISKFNKDEIYINNPKIQEYTRQFLEKKHYIYEIVKSIKKVGFLNLDRMIVKPMSNDKYVVIEGNRRLAALKTVIGDIQRKIFNPPTHVYKSLKNIEVLLLPKEFSDIYPATWFLQGIRHVTGIRNWGPYQQAELLHTLIRNYNFNVSQAGEFLNLGPKRSATIWKAYLALRQMEKDEEFGRHASPELFSHFEQAYTQKIVRNWLQWDDKLLDFQSKENLKLFYKWILFDNEKLGQPKLKASDIRDILPVVLKNEESKNYFVNEDLNLSEAYSFAVNDGTNNTIKNLAAYLKNTEKELKKLSPATYLDEENIKLVKRIYNLSYKLLYK